MIAIYARVSTEEQVHKGYSLQDQVRECVKLASSDDTKQFVDQGQSGEFLERPALSVMRTEIAQGLITKVICLDPDRLSRKLMHQLLLAEEFDHYGVTLQFVTGDYQQTPEGALFYSLRGAIAEFEKAKITERMSRGRIEKARQGKVLRDFQVYGYEYDKTSQQFVVNPLEAAVVRKIFALFLRPRKDIDGISAIARYLTQQQIPTKRGAAKWHRQVIRQILMNPIYIGKFYQNRWDTRGMLANRYTDKKVSMKEKPPEEWIEISCPPIVSQDVFNQAQALLEQSRRRWAGRRTDYLLSGLLRCGLCGTTMIGRHSHAWGKDVFYYTDQKNSQKKGCGNKIARDYAEETIWQATTEFLASRMPSTAMMANSPETQTIQAELEVLHQKRERLVDLATEGIIDSKQLQSRMESLEHQESFLRKEIGGKIPYHQKNSDWQSLLTAEARVEVKKTTLRLLIKEVLVYRQGMEIITF